MKNSSRWQIAEIFLMAIAVICGFKYEKSMRNEVKEEYEKEQLELADSGKEEKGDN